MNRKNILIIVHSIVLLIIVLIALFTVTSTLAKHITSMTNSDSAEVAEFNVTISAPDELNSASEHNPYILSFTGEDQTISLGFSIFNDNEIVVICTPYFDSDVQFDVIVNEEIVDYFVIGIGETVDFSIEMISDGLIAEALATKLILSIEQV